MKRFVIASLVVIGMLSSSLASADNYTLNISTNANQEQVLGILYTNDCKAALAESQPALAGCTAECVCNPILAEKSTYLLGKLAAWFTESRQALLRERAREIAVKYMNLNASQRGQVDNASGLPPLQ